MVLEPLVAQTGLQMIRYGFQYCNGSFSGRKQRKTLSRPPDGKRCNPARFLGVNQETAKQQGQGDI
ncbi:hypothetical protein [Sedimentitalea nanhaiensis]|uniref:hypothetical protein n=1 Tax=Sedimentitalea nanhaiensis TaxID=999627 RepID=UPI00040661C0|nr:hypothetical protein [Sedimentitalea nanhaiensis]